MKESEKFVGKIKKHEQLGVVSVDSIHNNSRVLVDVTCLDRGKGFNDVTQKYDGVKVKKGWYRGENREYQHKDFVHIKELS